MNRKLKALGMLVAALAFSALAVSAASADTALKTTNKNVILTANQIPHAGGNKFTTSNGEITCENEKVSYSGTATSPNNVSPFTIYEARVHPTYSGCTAKGLGLATVTTKGCDFTLTDRTSAAGHNIAHLECNAGSTIQVHIPSIDCVLKMSTQTPDGGIVYTNNEVPTPDDVTATVTSSGITYVKKKTSTTGVPGVICNGVGNEADGTLLTQITIRADEDKGMTGNLTEETYVFDPGNQLPLTVEDIANTP
jgi:hypothetical protein